MTAVQRRAFALLLIAFFLAAIMGGRPLAAEPAVSSRGVVATVHPLATDSAVAVVRRGGNPVDAAVAAVLTLGVVNNHLSGLGGGCFILIRLPDGELVAIDGRETAPAGATRDMYLKQGRARPELSRVGPLAVAVPGELAALAYAVEHYGRCHLSDLLAPGAEIAERGFPIGRPYAEYVKSVKGTLVRFDGTREVLLKPDGSNYESGEILKQPDLARTYRCIARHGTDWFYRGPFARKTGDWMAAHGGILTAKDFAGYRVRLREPIVTTYRDCTIVGFPPPSSGGVHVAQILNILEHFDLKSLQRRGETRLVHVVGEAMKLAFADRAHWLGDADFAKVPRGLMDKRYAAKLAGRIDLDKATKVPRHGVPPRSDTDLFGKHTTHVAAAGKDGTWVAITATLNLRLGSKVIVPGTGVVLNNQMDDFSIQPGVPNAFGLVGAEANAVAPGKRPLSSMSPTIVLRDGKPVLTLGAAGGPKIITQTLLTIVNRVDLGMNLADAVRKPRFHHQWLPDRLMVEKTLGAAVVRELKQYGHDVEEIEYVGVTQAASVSADGTKLIGVHDPRVKGKAAGF